MATSAKDRLFRGKTFSAEELATIEDLVTSCAGLSQAELAHTVCELLDWKRPTGALKSRECRDLLEQLEREGRLSLPCKRAAGRPRGSRTRVPVTAAGDPGEELIGTVRDFGEVELELIEGAAAQHRFRELIGRYHSLGYRVPFGAHLRYLVYVSKPQRVVVGACQFSSPAWRMAVRDRWIGWDEATRKRNLQRVINNSRFLILPWVRVKNLASKVLSLTMRQLREDWQGRYGVEPFLVETLVDGTRYRGSCYRAANWIVLGETTGRGRMDRRHQRHGVAPKTVLVYPLFRDAARKLREA